VKPLGAGLSQEPKLETARCRKVLERKHIGKIEALPAAVSQDFPNAFAPKKLRHLAVSNFGFWVYFIS